MPDALTPVIGSPCRVYPRDNGKVVGPQGVPDNEGGVSVTVSRVEGSGAVGTYQAQESDSPDGPWNDVGAAIAAAGVTSVAVKASYVQVLMTVAPGVDTSTRVCVRTDVD
jgi:hypothetical protein